MLRIGRSDPNLKKPKPAAVDATAPKPDAVHSVAVKTGSSPVTPFP